MRNARHRQADGSDDRTGVVGSESLWRRFATVVGLDADREDIATNRLRVAKVDDLQQGVEQLLAGLKADDVIAELAAAGVPAGRIRTLPEVYEWEQVRGLGLLHTMAHPVLGDLTVPGGAVRYDGAVAASPVPPAAR